jgi:hypothetical protein
MAFTLRNLSVLAYANGFTLWHYRTGDDALTVLDRDDFFNDAGDLIAPGDIVMASGPQGARMGAIAQKGAHLVLGTM